MNKLYRSFQPILTEAGLKRFGLILEYSLACKTLRGIVHSYLQISTAKPTPYPVIPDGTQAVYIAPHGAKIGGAQSRAHDIQILQPGDYFGIRFHTGLSTKEFVQTIRIQHVCKKLYMAPGNSLNAALDLGFFDQSHLIKDYKKHLLLSPNLFLDRFKSDFYNS